MSSNIYSEELLEASDEHSIAVIGMACKFPGADNLEAYWQTILTQNETISFFTQAELIAAGIDPNLVKDPNYVPARGILSDVDKFDAPFFGYSPFEASITDPQHRVFLEQVWTALENAGYTAEQVSGQVGVFAGMADSTYLQNNLLKNADFLASYDKTQTMLATSSHFLSTKAAYAMGLTGPCINVNTACSTALVAISLACESLNNYDCDMALAGGVTIIVPQQSGYLYQESGILSPDGHCRVFDKNAKGTVISNGCGIVVLKRLAEAIKDHDNIVAVIKGWAVNNDGSDKVGFTAPSVNGQATCVRQALAYADIKPTEVDYLEAHGTGTILGDPIEIAALTRGYQYATHQKSQYCAIGSIKANIGHTDVAAGVAGFIKTVLAIQEKVLPPNLYYIEANEKIRFTETPFVVSSTAKPWLMTDHKRTAAVNSLGFGGTNAHVILQEAPVLTSTPSHSANILILSGKTPKALSAMTTNLYAYLQKSYLGSDSSTMLADTAYTLQLGRKHFKYRKAIVYKEPDQLLQALSDSIALDTQPTELKDKQNSRVIFCFPGQGTQYVNMALDIYKEQPFFKAIIDDCCEDLRTTLGLDLRELLFSSEINNQYGNEKLKDTLYAQPAIFIIEYALARLLIELGIKPDAMIGHSVGEYVAATIAGVMDLHDALEVIVMRARLMNKTEPGTMLAVPLDREKITSLITTDMSLAAHNAPELCVVSGTHSQIASFERRLKPLLDNEDLSCVHLHTSHAFHSPTMDEIIEEFSRIIASRTFKSPQIPYISNVTGDWISLTDLANKRYWTDHIRNTVRFLEGVNNLKLTENDIVIEVGSGKTLIHLIRQHQKKNKPSVFVHSLPSYQESEANSYVIFLETISKLWLQGREISWKNLYTKEIRKRKPLPTYPFEKQSHWIYPSKTMDDNKSVSPSKELLYAPTWERDLKLSSLKMHAVSITYPCWLIFTNHDPWCDLLVKQLRSENLVVYTVTMGNYFEHLDEHSFIIVPNNKDHYLKLLKKLQIKNDCPIALHTWSLNNDIVEHDKLFHIGALSLLYLSQAFTEIFVEKNLHTLVLSNRIYTVLGNENILPEKITIVGPCKVIPQEQETLFFKFIDLEVDSDLSSTALASYIYWEANTIFNGVHQTEIAYRGGYRWLRQLKPCSKHINAHQINRIKFDGVYLITGGLGGMGLVLAQYLAEKYQAHIILLSKSSFPHENQWQALIDDSNNRAKKIFKQITALINVKKYAASLTIVQAAVENEEQLRVALDFIRKKHGCIDGVIHAAGIPGGGIAQLKSAEEYHRILEPKVKGTQNLFNLLKDEKLDFIVLISSLTSITGLPGQIDYCSANLVLDAYATANQFTQPVFCVAMNWQSWRDVGMAAESTTKLIVLDETNSTSPEEAVVLFEKILNSDLNQVVISGNDPDTLITNTEVTKSSSENQVLSDEEKISTSEEDVTTALTELWCNVLGINEVGLDDDFDALGGHSLLAIILLEKIRKRFGLKLSQATFLKSKTIRALSGIIQSNKQENEVSPLVMLEQGGDKTPLFILHPIGGSVFYYLSLVRFLNHDRPIYGLQDPSVDQEKVLFNTLEDMATTYRKNIQTVQPKGPYYLCGASFGATLVIEIAHQLLQHNEQVNFIGLLDGWATFSSVQRDEHYARSIILRHQQDETSHVLPKNVENQIIWEKMLAHRISMMIKYQPKKLSAKITLFKANKILQEYQPINADDNHWSAYSTYPINIIQISGDHNTILQEPHVHLLAKHIQQCLDLTE